MLSPWLAGRAQERVLSQGTELLAFPLRHGAHAASQSHRIELENRNLTVASREIIQCRQFYTSL